MNDNFKLTKYYLDCISEDNNLIILYSAKLEWNLLKIGFMSLFHKNHNDCVNEKSIYSNQTFPKFYDNTLVWENPKLNINCNFKLLQQPISADLSPENDGSVLWECLSPICDSEIYTDSLKIIGKGYLERLTLTKYPWELGLSNLYWGRFIADEDYIVWIIWEGEFPLTKIYYNGSEYSECRINEERLEFGNFQLLFQENFTIRNSYLLNGILKNIPFIDKFTKTPVSKIKEIKHYSKSKFIKNGQEIFGNTIREKVLWE